MNLALAAITAVVVGGAVVAVTARDARATLLGLLVVLLGSAVLADPLPGLAVPGNHDYCTPREKRGSSAWGVDPIASRSAGPERTGLKTSVTIANETTKKAPALPGPERTS